MNSTDSEFWGFVKDQYTTLQEAHDRILATEVTARWRYGWTGDEQPAPDWERVLRAGPRAPAGGVRRDVLALAPADPVPMGARVIDSRPAIDEVRLSLPNKHHFLVDLEPFGLKNDNEVYFAADRPYGLIEATVLRDGAEAAHPGDGPDRRPRDGTP